MNILITYVYNKVYDTCQFNTVTEWKQQQKQQQQQQSQLN